VPTPLTRGEKLLWNSADDAPTYNQAIAAFDEALKGESDKPRLAIIHARRSEALMRLGDLSSSKDDKKTFYDKGKAAAQTAIGLDARCSRCHFWFAANVGRWGQTKGVLQALSLLDDIKNGFSTALKLNPNDHDARLALGKIDEAVPGFAGGSVERAEAAFRDVTKRDPHHTRAMLDLAELLKNEGRKPEARDWATKALKESAPTHRGEHRKFDVPRAKQILAELDK